MIGAAAHGAANAVYQAQLEAQRADEQARRHKAKIARQHAAQAHAQALVAQKQQIKAKQAAEDAQQDAEGAESFIAGAAVSPLPMVESATTNIWYWVLTAIMAVGSGRRCSGPIFQLPAW